jgi:AcrR family transcriptional regulator
MSNMDSGDNSPGRRLTRAEAKAHTRERLLAAAAQVFARKGFAGASVEDIAETAGFSIGALYSNFGGKEELFLELTNSFRTDLIATAAQTVREHGVDSDQALAELSQLLVRATDRAEDFALLQSEFWTYAMRNPGIRQDIGARIAGSRSSLEELLGPELAQRGAPPEASAPAVATVVAALFSGLLRQRLVNPGTVPDDLFGLALKWLFTGISASSPP